MFALRWQWARMHSMTVHELYDALALRQRVFILEQGPFQDLDGADVLSWHLLGRDENGAAHAYLRVVDPGIKYNDPSIGRVVTSPEVRGTGQGRALMAEGIARCTQVWPTHGIRISAQARLERFYSGLGFMRVGDTYIEDTIPHVQMFRPAS